MFKNTVVTLRKRWPIKPFCIGGLLVFFVAICWCNAMNRYGTADFMAMNGTFQNYNPVRRLQAGQTPYADFIDYLGMGHLYIGYLITKLFGGSYSDSIVAFQFLSFFTFGVVFCVLGYVITRRLGLSLAITNVALILVLYGYQTGILYSKIWADAIAVGNSARFIRGLILPLVCILWFAGMKKGPKLLARTPKLTKHRNLVLAIVLGILGGAAFVWSNDYGISCWVCLVIMTMFALACRTKSFKTTLLYSFLHVVVSCITIYLVVQIFTWGHFSQWLSSTFGTGSYQRWYYNSAKSYYLYNIDFSFMRFVQVLFTGIYLIKLWRRCGSMSALIRFGIPAFANLVGFCAANEYKLLSGDRAAEVADAIIYATILFEAVNLVFVFCKSERVNKVLMLSTMVASVTATGLWLGYAVIGILPRMNTPETALSGTYLPALDGNVTERYEDLMAADAFLEGEKVFATYASAQEIMLDCYQPSGVDYIIHVLGDEAREEYLESFRNGDFRYTSTIKDTYSGYEDWVRHSNWFFYRELYQNWHRVFTNDYQVYWERNEQEGENTITLTDVDISVEVLDEGSTRITFQTDPSITGTADVWIDYAVTKGDNLLSNVVITSMLQLKDGKAESVGMPDWNLRPESQEYVPVDIRNGFGQLDLSSAPLGSSKLEVYEVRCERVFVVDNYVELISSEKNTDTCLFTVLPTEANRQLVETATSVCIGEKNYTIQRVFTDGEYMTLECAYDQQDIPLRGNYILLQK